MQTKFIWKKKKNSIKRSCIAVAGRENLDNLIKEIEKTSDVTKLCRETARGIKDKTDKDKTIKLLSEMMTADKMVHGKEIFALQVIAEEWEMYLE